MFERLLGLDEPARERELAALKRARPDLHPQVLALVESDRKAEACGYLEDGPPLPGTGALNPRG